MKRLIVGILIGCTILVACTAPAEETEAKGEPIWEVIGEQKLDSGDVLTELRHIETGCHWVHVNSTEATALEPMFKPNMGGTQMPYCTDK